jgi:hypothetical protein
MNPDPITERVHVTKFTTAKVICWPLLRGGILKQEDQQLYAELCLFWFYYYVCILLVVTCGLDLENRGQYMSFSRKLQPTLCFFHALPKQK